MLSLLRRKLLKLQINAVAAQQRRAFHCSIQTGKSSIFTFSIALDWQETTYLFTHTHTTHQHSTKKTRFSLRIIFFPPQSASGSWQCSCTTAVSNYTYLLISLSLCVLLVFQCILLASTCPSAHCVSYLWCCNGNFSGLFSSGYCLCADELF